MTPQPLRRFAWHVSVTSILPKFRTRKSASGSIGTEAAELTRGTYECVTCALRSAVRPLGYAISEYPWNRCIAVPPAAEAVDVGVPVLHRRKRDLIEGKFRSGRKDRSSAAKALSSENCAHDTANLPYRVQGCSTNIRPRLLFGVRTVFESRETLAPKRQA